jgi:hypothetical protein
MSAGERASAQQDSLTGCCRPAGPLAAAWHMPGKWLLLAQDHDCPAPL